jgi:hypothetical protein
MSLPMEAETERRSPNKLWPVLGCIVSLLIGLAIGHVATRKMERGSPAFPTSYQAVLLSNGSVYYGKLSGYGTRNPLLTDVFYILSKTNPDTKQVTNVLVKRGKELHGPDRMYLNSRQIIFVEPVGNDSTVAKLINEANR